MIWNPPHQSPLTTLGQSLWTGIGHPNPSLDICQGLGWFGKWQCGILPRSPLSAPPLGLWTSPESALHGSPQICSSWTYRAVFNISNKHKIEYLFICQVKSFLKKKKSLLSTIILPQKNHSMPKDRISE